MKNFISRLNDNMEVLTESNNIFVRKTSRFIRNTISFIIGIFIISLIGLLITANFGSTNDGEYIVPPPANGSTYTDLEKAYIMHEAIYGGLRDEFMGGLNWLPNNPVMSMLIKRSFMDNKAEYQIGLARATQLPAIHFAEECAVSGKGELRDDELVKGSRALSSPYDMVGGTTQLYLHAFSGVYSWKDRLANDKAVYEMRNDDLYNMLGIMIKDLDIVYSKIKSSDSTTSMDNAIMRAKGYIKFHSRVLPTMIALYPDIFNKGAPMAIENAIDYLDELREYNSFFYNSFQKHNSDYATIIDNYRNRIEDIRNSIKI